MDDFLQRGSQQVVLVHSTGNSKQEVVISVVDCALVNVTGVTKVQAIKLYIANVRFINSLMIC